MTRAITKKRHLFRWILAVVGAVVFLVVVALVMLALPPGESFIRGVLESRLSGALHQPVTIARLETNVLSRIQLDSLAVRADTSAESTPVLTIDRIRVRYRLWPLLSRTIAVDSLLINGVDLNLTRDSAVGFNLALLDTMSSGTSDTTAATAGGSSYTLELGPTSISDVNLDYRDRVLGLDGLLHGLAVYLREESTGAYTFNASSDSGSLVYGDSPPGKLAVQAAGSYRDGSLQLDTLAVALERLRLAASGVVPTDSTAPMSGKLTLTGDPQTFLDIAHTQFGLPEVTIDSTINLSVDLSGTRAQPHANLTLDLSPIHTCGIDITDTHLGAAWTGREVTIDSLMLALFGGTITGKGKATLDTTVTSSLHLTLSSIDFAALWSGLYQSTSLYTGRLQGDIDLTTVGTNWHDWSAQLALGARNAKYRDLPLNDLHIDASIDTGAVIASISQQYFNIDARVKVNEPDVSGRLTLQIDRLGPLAGLFNVPDVTGALSGSADLSGTIDNPTLDADIRGHDITYRNFPVDTVALIAHYADSVVTLTDLTASGRRDRLDSLGPIFGIDSVSGSLDYAAKLSGTLDALTGRLDLHLHNPGYRSYKLDSAAVIAQLDSGRVHLDAADLYRDSLFVTARGDFKFEGPSGTLDASAYDLAARADTSADTSAAVPAGLSRPAELISNLESAFSLPDTGNFEITVKGAGIDIGALEDMLVDSFDIGGIASFEATLRGPTDNLSGALKLSVKHPRYEDVKLDSLITDIALAADTLHIDTFHLYGADQSLDARLTAALDHDSTGSYTLTTKSRVRGRLDIVDFDLRVLEPFLWAGGQLTGHSTVHLNWDGTVADPNVRGHLALDKVSVVLGPDIESIKNINLVSAIADTVFTIDSASGIVHGTPFDLHGSATLSGGTRLRTDIAMTLDTVGTVDGSGLLARDTLDFTANVKNFNLGVAQPFVPMVTNLGGRLSSRVRITGNAATPVIDGRLEIDSLTAGYEMLAQPVRNGMIKATFTRTTVMIDTADAVIGKGTVSASGQFSYADSTITDINLHLKGRNVRIDPMPDFYITVDSASLAYTRPNEYFQLGGDIYLGDTKYRINIEPTAILPWTRQAEQTPPDFPEFVQQTRLSVRVRNADNIWVDNNLAHIKLHAELEAIGNVERPNVSGQLSITEGYLLYLDRKFTVQTGVFYFNDPNKINPDLNLTATTSVTSYQALQATTYNITFGVQGTMEQPQVTLTSVPALERADIISLLTLGATRQQLAGGGSTGQILQERAEVLATQQISGYVGQRVGNLLGLDQVSVQGNIFNTSDTTGPELIAAKQISNNLRVTYKTTVGHLNDQAVQVNYDIWRHFSLEGQTDRRGAASLNFKYGIRFR